MPRGRVPYIPRWGEDEVFANVTEAWASLPLAEHIAPLARNGLFEAEAGSTALFRIKARTKLQLDRLEGGHEVTAFIVPIATASPGDERYEGYAGTIREHDDGNYDVSYEAEVAGTYVVQARIDGQRVQHCYAHHGPAGSMGHPECSFNDPVLTVVHGEMDADRCSVLGDTDEDTPATPTPVGTAVNVSVIARDSFGNTRMGSDTTSYAGNGDGSSDVFVVKLSDNEGHQIHTSSAVQIITAAFDGDDPVNGSSFRVEFGGAISRPLSTLSSAEEVQQALVGILGNDELVDVVVSESTAHSGGGAVAWRATFLSHLQEWSESPLSVVPAGDDGRTAVSVRKEASDGVYPIEYTLRYPGRYRMSITDALGEFITGGCRVVEATSADTQPFPSPATRDELYGGDTVESLTTTIGAEISPPEPEAQAQALTPPTTTHEIDPSFIDNSTSLPGLPQTFELAYGGDRTVSTPLVGATELNAAYRDPSLATHGGAIPGITRSSGGARDPEAFNINGNCSIGGADRFGSRVQPGHRRRRSRGILDRAIVADTTAFSKFSITDVTRDVYSSKWFITNTHGLEVFAGSSGWSGRPRTLEAYYVHRLGPSIRTLIYRATVRGVQPIGADLPVARAELAGEDSAAAVMYHWVQSVDHILTSTQQVVQTRPLHGLRDRRLPSGSFDPLFKHWPTTARVSTREAEPPERENIYSGAGRAALSSERRSPGLLSTQDDTVPDPTAVSHPDQSPNGFAIAYGVTMTFPNQLQSPGALSTRDGHALHPPTALLLAAPEGQAQDEATTKTVDVVPVDRIQRPVLAEDDRGCHHGLDGGSVTPASASPPLPRPLAQRKESPEEDDSFAALLSIPGAPFPVGRPTLDDGLPALDGPPSDPPTGLPPGRVEGQAQEQAAIETVDLVTFRQSQPPHLAEYDAQGSDGLTSGSTTPASVFSLLPGPLGQCEERATGDEPSSAPLLPGRDAVVPSDLSDTPAAGGGDEDDGPAASTGPPSLMGRILAAAFVSIAVWYERLALPWAWIVWAARGGGVLFRNAVTTARSFGAAVVARAMWVVGILRSVGAMLRNLPATGRSFGAGIFARVTWVFGVLQSVGAVRVLCDMTRNFGSRAVSAAAWVWEETSSDCPLDRFLVVLIALWVAGRDIVRCIVVNALSGFWSATQERNECELRFMPETEPGVTRLRELARALALLAVYFGMMAGLVVYLAIIRPKWIIWTEEQQAFLEDAAAKAADVAYRWEHRTPRAIPRKIKYSMKQQNLAVAVQVLLAFPENRELLFAYKHEQDGLASPPWWRKWSRQWKDRQLLLELVEVYKELWFVLDEILEMYYDHALCPLDGLDRLNSAVEKLLGRRAQKKQGAELELFLQVMLRTFPPEKVAFMNCGKSVASSCCNGSTSINHSAALKIEGQLDIVPVDIIPMPFMDIHETRRCTLFKFLPQRATPRPGWIPWRRTCKDCTNITPMELLELKPLQLERLPELLYIKINGKGMRGWDVPDFMYFRAPGSDRRVRYLLAAVLNRCDGTPYDISCVKNMAIQRHDKWCSHHHPIGMIEVSPPIFIILRKAADQRR